MTKRIAIGTRCSARQITVQSPIINRVLHLHVIYNLEKSALDSKKKICQTKNSKKQPDLAFDGHMPQEVKSF